VFISGATGPHAAAINGYFAPTQEKGSDGRFVLSKSGDASMCIEHFGGKWQLKPVSSKGKDACRAYVAGDCALQDCTSRVWKVQDGQTLVDQASVKMATGSEAEQKVCGGCKRAPRRSPPPRTSQSCLVILICTAHLTRISFHRLLKAKRKLLLKQRLPLKQMLPLKQRLLLKQRLQQRLRSKPKLRRRLLLKQRLLRLLRKSKPSTVALWNYWSGWGCRSTRRPSCELFTMAASACDGECYTWS